MFGATAHKIEPIKNITAVMRIIFFLPKTSASRPFKIAPKAAPTRTTDTKSPDIKLFKPQSLFMYKSAPEITPVSKPDNNPPSAVKKAVMYNIFTPYFESSSKIPINAILT